MAETPSLEVAGNLRELGKFSEALSIYESAWQRNPDSIEPWDALSFIICLLRIGKCEEALDISRKLYRNYPESSYIKSAYSQSIYYAVVCNYPKGQLPILRKAVQAIHQLTPYDQTFSLAPHAVFRLVKGLLDQELIDWTEIEYWLLHFDPAKLDDKPRTWQGKKGKTQSAPSFLEQWYSYMIRALGGLNKHTALLECIAEARKRKLKWHYQNDIWLACKEAFALKALDRKEESAAILRNLTELKQDWFFLSDLADVTDDPVSAFRVRCKAALSPTGELPMKVKLFEKILAFTLDRPAWKDTSTPLLELVIGIRSEKGWKIPDHILDLIAKTENYIVQPISAVDLYRRLLPWFRKGLFHGITFHHGLIVTVKAEQKFGFIQSSDGSRVFFYFRDALMPPRHVTRGQSVAFDLITSFDKKQNKVSKRAVCIILER